MLSAKQHLSMIIWSVKTAWKVNPRVAFIKFSSNILNQFVSILSSAFIAYLLNYLTNLQSKDTSDSYILIGLFLGLQLYILVAQQLSDLSTLNFSSEGGWKLERELYIALNELPISIVESPEFSNQYMRALDARQKILESFNKIVDLSGSLLRIVALTIILLPIYPIQVILLFAVIYPRYKLVGNAVKKVLQYTIGETESRKKHEVIGWSLKSVPSQIEVRLIQAFKYIDNILNGYWLNYYKVEGSLHRKRAFIASILQYLHLVIIASVIYFLVKDYSLEIISLGTVTFILTNMQSLSGSLNGIVSVFTNLIEMNVKCSDYKLIIDLNKKESIKISEQESAFYNNKVDEKLKQTVPPKIDIKSLSFSYPNNGIKVLEEINLEILPKEKIAIVGHNGAGKTTLIKLLLKMYDIDDESISINDFPLQQTPFSYWTKEISCLMQNYNTYQGLSIRDNVYLANTKDEINEERIIESLKQAELWSDIEKLPEKLDTLISANLKNGTNFSTGQLQKLSIARFLYSSSPIVIFDEPTSAIDAISEANIFENIYSTLTDKTVIIISHRFSTVRRADRIIVMDNGQVIENGTHRELLDLNGTYANAFKVQAEGYK